MHQVCGARALLVRPGPPGTWTLSLQGQCLGDEEQTELAKVKLTPKGQSQKEARVGERSWGA